jgi:uncharacterized protein
VVSTLTHLLDMKKIEMEIVALSHSVGQSHNYAVVLGEKDGHRRLPIVIGGFEAQAIAVSIEKMIPNRPLTHDLMKSLMDTFSIQLREIMITDLVEGVFYAKLVCRQENGQNLEIDSRTSDALAMAVRFGCPIFTYEFILESAGIAMEQATGEEDLEEDLLTESKEKKDLLSSYSLDALKTMLEEVLNEEDYERAAQIRDEISRRSKNS